MSLIKKVEKEINNQIQEEFYSAYIYLGMAAYFDSIGLEGFANWMKVQYEEEYFHMTKFYNFMNARGGKVELQKLDQPPSEYESPIAAFEAALKHEQHITGRINLLYKLARDESDYAFEQFLLWFIEEQVEEEENVQTVIDKLKLFGNNGKELYLLDQELGQRTFTPPTSGE